MSSGDSEVRSPTPRGVDEPRGDFDYSTPEARRALSDVTELLLEVRTEIAPQVRLYERKLRLYERSLGLAVIPVLVRRLALRGLHRLRSRR
jgi:hypothetical protein